MLFYQPLFIFYVLPVGYIVFLAALARKTLRRNLLIAFSVVFYFWIEPRIVPLVILSMLADFYLGRVVGDERRSGRARKVALIAGIVQNLGILAFFKYAVFLVDNLSGLSHSLGGPVLPHFSIL